ncbi:cellulase family glycosylhydrolase [Amycolatopsis acidiphila]|uniref:Cellulase family glycosylhydrolase n=2 Tax=Amycolatopsis acidiphila TaxID=715473 RepID=A0A558AM90_9PSEU|nr:cellulase family glycosylhydrolase [Amycolatopsis acidiphila]
MENFITGYPANESMMRAAVGAVLGPERAELFFDRLLEVFFTEADARFLAGAGVNSVRIPVNYRHFEDDAAPFTLLDKGFQRLDRVDELCAAQGFYSIIDLHALPGSQNHHWHSDNPTHIPLLWRHPHFQDRAVHLWEALADRYRDNPWVAGYNPVNEPADESRQVLGPFYRRLLGAIRAVDPRHVLFLDGNTYATEFDVFAEPWDNVVYTCHDYAAAGLGKDAPSDPAFLEEKFRQRTEYSRRTGTPISSNAASTGPLPRTPTPAATPGSTPSTSNKPTPAPTSTSSTAPAATPSPATPTSARPCVGLQPRSAACTCRSTTTPRCGPPG